MPPEPTSTSSSDHGLPSDARTVDGTDVDIGPGETGTDDLAHLLRQVAAAPERPLEPPAPLQEGDLVGESFRIESVIGAGGMGVVYRARDIELDRAVAIKVRSGAARSSDIARMLREAKVMAQLSHPNVVTVYEVGTHAGRLFIAMEYVDAGSLRAWLGARPRGWREIVDVFIQAAHGLAAAHALGLVHRDFKPDNVLVDRTGRARVADFGVARLAESSAPSSDLLSLETSSLGERLTRTGAAVGTPAYMAPEQFIGGDIGPAADQFAFCVSLHEALWGQRPFAGRDVNELIAAVALERVVTPKQGDVPAWIRRALLRGLRAAPEDRWPTMDALVSVLRRDPAARRRRLGLAGAALLTTSAGGWWAAAQNVQPCEGTDTRVTEIWSPARRQELGEAFSATGLPHASSAQADAEASLDAYAAEWADMARDACEATRLRGDQSEMLMDLRMACLVERASSLEGVMRVLVGGGHEVVQNASRLTGSLPPLERCSDTERLLAGVPPPEDAATADAVSGLRARLSEYAALARARSPANAVHEIPGLLAEAEATGYEPLVTEVLFVKAQLEEDTGAADDAERDYDAALWQAVRLRHDELVPRIALKLAFVIGYDKSDRDQGERLLRLAEATADPENAELWPNIEAVRGALALHAADHTAAQEAYRARLRYEEDTHGEEHRHVAEALGTLAETLDTVGRFDEAAEHYQRAISIGEAAVGPEHPLVGQLVGSLAIHKLMVGDVEAAMPLLERAIAIEERAVGTDAPALIDLLENAAKAHTALEDFDRAEIELDRAVAIARKAGRDPDVDTRILEARRLLASRRGRWQECVDLSEATLAVTEREHGPDHPRTASCLAAGARCLWPLGRYEEALADLERALRIREAVFGERSEPAAHILAMIAELHEEMGNDDEVIAFCDRGIEILEELGRERSPAYDHMVEAREAVRAKSKSGRKPG